MNDSERTLAIIASTMRSGSTLLKALMAQAPDVSNLNEVNFQGTGNDRSKFWRLAPQRIVLCKRPCWYQETRSYPRLPSQPIRAILLVRDCYDTVESLRKMSLGRFEVWGPRWLDRWLARSYWMPVNRKLLELSRSLPDSTRLVRYEDLVLDPLRITRELFEFIGSSQEEGVDRYDQPEGRWRWGRDDNSPQIRSLTVQPPRVKPQTNARLTQLIDHDDAIRKLRRELGYL